MVATLAGLLLVTATRAVAQEPCTVPAALNGFAHPSVGTALVPGRAIRVTLATDTRWAVAPEKPPTAGSRGAAVPLTITTAGRYRVALDGPIWVDVVSGGQRLSSVEHGHAPTCSGARKLVGYDLTPGRYVVQLSGTAASAATVMILSGASAE